MEKNNNFSDITLEQLAQMIAKEFASIRKNMATKDDLEALRGEFGTLQKETQAGFAYINITLDKHMGDVREQTDSLAHRVKRLEESVFGAGK